MRLPEALFYVALVFVGWGLTPRVTMLPSELLVGSRTHPTPATQR